MTPDFRAAIAIVLLFVALGFVFLNPGWIKPDSVGVYAYLRSAVVDRDLSFLNEWAGFRLVQDGATMFKETGPDGRLANHWSIGAAILCLPFYVVAHVAALLLGLPRDGVTGIYTIVLAWCSVLFTALTLIIARSLTVDVAPPLRRLALTATLIGTPLFFYTFRMPLGTHIAGTLAVALLVLVLAREPSPGAFLTGLTFGFAAATRVQHFVLIGAVVVVAARQRWPLRAWLQFAVGTLIGWSPQAVAWWILYDHPLGPVVKGASLAGTTWSPFRDNAMLDVLFSGWHGLFTWSPVALLSIIGWCSRIRRDRVAAICVAMFAGEWIANGLLDYFWGGYGFGQRRFVDLAVPFAVGIAWFVDAARDRVMRAAAIVLTIGCTLWSGALLALTFADKLELAKDTTVADLVHSMSEIGAALAGFRVASLRAFSLHAIGALLIVVGALLVARLRIPKPIGIAITFLVLDAALMSLRPATLRHAAEDKRRFAISDERRAIGPLVDQRNLVADLLQYRLRRGDEKEAQRLRIELATIERAINEKK